MEKYLIIAIILNKIVKKYQQIYFAIFFSCVFYKF